MPKPLYDIAPPYRPQLTPCIDSSPCIECEPPAPPCLDLARREAEAGTLDWQGAIDTFLAIAGRWRGESVT